MFTWICPQCGREVPPAYDECPDCAARQKAAGEPPATTAAETPPQAPVQPPPVARPVAPAAVPPSAPPVYAAPAPRAPLPTWLMSIVWALAFMGVALGGFWMVQYFRGGAPAAATSGAAPPGAAKAPAKSTHPLQKFIEVTGIRLLEDARKKPEVRFVVVNHSGAEITELAATVTIWARTVKSEEESVGNFTFKLTSLGPYESKEAVAPLNTKLRVYELPDWQNVTDEVQITAP